MSRYVLYLQQIDRTNFNLAGGKAANLGELFRIKGIEVPPGFCITTEAYKKVTESNVELNALLNELTHSGAEQRATIGAKIRQTIGNAPIPADIAEEIISHLNSFGPDIAFAVRSSATAEDLPTASFAGQQDSYLNIIGTEKILEHITKCWASLFTERAITYREQNGFDHRKVRLAVIVQEMIFPLAAGVLFTADPVTCNRKVISIDAVFGLGEALVSGLTNPDNFKVREGKIIDKRICTGKEADPTLREQEVLQLAHIGRQIETHFGWPQDIEWCLANNTFYIVQSRPVTTLYPVPETNDREDHVYISVGHQQMMTDPMKPLGIAIWQLTAARPMYQAGGRLFVDVGQSLAAAATRKAIIEVLGKSDSLLKDALITLTQREQYNSAAQSEVPPPKEVIRDFDTLIDYDPAVVPRLIGNAQASLDELKQDIQTKSGPDVIDFILADIKKLRKILSDPQSFGVFMTAMNASSWINEKMNEWLGEKNAVDTLTQSAPTNITSEMGLELLDVADAIRPHPEVIDYLKNAKDDGFFNKLLECKGGIEAQKAIQAYLDKYGMRCAGEIDITKTRWSEKPSTLVPLILGNIKNCEPGAGKRKFEQGLQEATKKEQEILEKLKRLPDGETKAEQTKRMIGLVRNFIGYREYPKYHIVNRYFIYKQALLKEAAQLESAGIIQQKEDIFYLTPEELAEAIRTRELNKQIIDKRKADYRSFKKLTPPRIMTSDGEIIRGKYKRDDLKPDTLPGLPVSSGIAEGRARVILNIADATLEQNDILVTRFTDPSWTPLFVSIKGLVTEVGGLMTHGAVIAREYGLPAVVGVENATSLIKDGQRIRVNGIAGYVEIC